MTLPTKVIVVELLNLMVRAFISFFIWSGLDGDSWRHTG